MPGLQVRTQSSRARGGGGDWGNRVPQLILLPAPLLPSVQDVCRSPAVRGALTSLIGEGYTLHPHGGFHPREAREGTPGLPGQGFHKDGFFPGNGHGLRYHRPEYLLFFYYPQDTTELSGPTEILPMSQYWSNDSDMEYNTHPLIGRVITGSGEAANGAQDPPDSQGGREYTELVKSLGWGPEAVERLTIKAGTVVLTHVRASCHLKRTHPRPGS